MPVAKPSSQNTSLSDLDALAAAVAERQLGLVDRVLGLEAQVAQLSIARQQGTDPSQAGRLAVEIADMRGSLTWRVGSLVTKPANRLARLLRRR